MAVALSSLMAKKHAGEEKCREGEMSKLLSSYGTCSRLACNVAESVLSLSGLASAMWLWRETSSELARLVECKKALKTMAWLRKLAARWQPKKINQKRRKASGGEMKAAQPIVVRKPENE